MISLPSSPSAPPCLSLPVPGLSNCSMRFASRSPARRCRGGGAPPRGGGPFSLYRPRSVCPRPSGPVAGWQYEPGLTRPLARSRTAVCARCRLLCFSIFGLWLVRVFGAGAPSSFWVGPPTGRWLALLSPLRTCPAHYHCCWVIKSFVGRRFCLPCRDGWLRET